MKNGDVSRGRGGRKGKALAQVNNLVPVTNKRMKHQQGQKALRQMRNVANLLYMKIKVKII